MGMGFIDRWRDRHGAAAPGPSPEQDQDSMAELLSECELLRELADGAGLRLADDVPSLTALDQLLPTWRDTPDAAEWLGNDAGLYLGTVVFRTVPGTRWRLAPDGTPVIVLPDGREMDVTAFGRSWAAQGSPQLTAAYLEAVDG
ncbi:DUF6278 family protein [Kitasatospora sp. NBC_00240]|uniref:DUF6278 family protein n=1 Tax=Kitasatospora sp. NBC_00240 TaxID=2903567 RepID=UPI00225B5EDE|nr:DUF6278 family protein [Kitasatospora sp. NBC_00240]MCX5212821.1 DUF6278 family protein [Kitasatospora sp. NBC_00240]